MKLARLLAGQACKFWGAALTAAAVSMPAAQAASIRSFSPQGTVAKVRQVVVQFDAAAVAFGEPRLPAPVSIDCSGAASEALTGTGRWTSEREWVFDFDAAMPDGVRCVAQVAADFAPLSGTLTGATDYAFQTGGPRVLAIRPDHYTIAEDQYFVLKLSTAVSAASLREQMWCASESVGERIAVRVVDEDERALLATRYYGTAGQDAQRYPVVTCNRRLTAGSRLQLVFGAGVQTLSGVAGQSDRRFDYRVRRDFAAEFSCERENAQTACLPNQPMRLGFNAPVAKAQAAQVYLEWVGAEETTAAATEKPTGTTRIYAKLSGGDEAHVPDLVEALSFPPTGEENQRYRVVLPADLTDDVGRPLRNADQFPLSVATGQMPPLVKFAAAPFGIVERFAEGRSGSDSGPALLPVTVRRVEADLAAQVLDASKINTLKLERDAEIIAWLHRVRRYHRGSVTYTRAARDLSVPLPPKPPRDRDNDSYYDDDNSWHIATRRLSLLEGRGGVQTLALPPQSPTSTAQSVRPFEVIGIPLPAGFHVVEIASPILGQALLDDEYAGERYGSQRKMYVRTSALVTNLAVHFKQGQDEALAWVTRLDDGSVVPGARVQVSDCEGKLLTAVTSDAQGVARFDNLPPGSTCYLGGDYVGRGYFVSARALDNTAEKNQPDLAFVWSHWQDGIEPWRFGLPTPSYYRSRSDDTIAHTVFDRTLLRAGETVSMKHTLRRAVGIEDGGLAPISRDALPDRAQIEHVGSGLIYTVPLTWQKSASSGGAVYTATSEFATPPTARLGEYSVTLQKTSNSNAGKQARTYVMSSYASGNFRVEEFRLPVFEGRIVVGQPQQSLVAVETLPAQVNISYLSGGAAAGLDVQVSAMLRTLDGAQTERTQWPRFAFTRESWASESDAYGGNDRDEGGDGEEEDGNGRTDSRNSARLIANRLPVKLDENGQGSVTLERLPAQSAPQQLRIEATYSDPNGEVQTLSATRTLWPAKVIAGIRAENWISTEKTLTFQTLALGLDDKPLAGVPLKVQAIGRTYTSSRKRLVGGFYSYDTQYAQTPLGVVCEGVSDAQGLLECTAQLTRSGNVELLVTATDDVGRTAAASTSVWVHEGELWFARSDDDRMDVIPEKTEYQPGETARFQVRMPYREATALVTVEREGISETHVVHLKGDNPTVELKVLPEWGPNAYVSVLALRGRIYEAPGYSHLFTWDRERASEYRAPTAMVDLAKPSFRLGVAEVRVGIAAHRLNVNVTTDQPVYQVRDTARVTIAATLPDGSPAAHADVVVAAVDQALLELMPNHSWNLLDAMLKRRNWGVATATAQMEIIGRRHYGRKAVAPGGDGASAGPRGQQRTLFDTLLSWQPRVQLDEHGRAEVTVPLNDSLTRFEIVAVAEHGVARFGTGSVALTATQDLQIVSGLPPLVRAGDTFDANLTLRNTTERDMAVRLAARLVSKASVSADIASSDLDDSVALPEQTVQIPAGSAQQIRWPVNLATVAAHATGALTWDIRASEIPAPGLEPSPRPARDSVKLAQRIVPSVPLTVLQGTLFQLDRTRNVPVAPPTGALADLNGVPLGGLRMSLAPTLATGLAGVRDWWQRYPYTCLEQTSSKTVGLGNASGWQRLMAQLPAYLSSSGLASYFPITDRNRSSGSDTLTAHLLTLSAQMQKIDARFVVPERERKQMQEGLLAFVEGRIKLYAWRTLQKHERDVRKIAALNALAVSGDTGGLARHINSIRIAPNEWPTHTLIDWVSLLSALQVEDSTAADHKIAYANHIQQAQQILRSRLNYQGSRAGFSNEADDDWWWLMHSADSNLARLVLLNLENPDWQPDLPRLVVGFIARQKNGAWRTTTANLWGGLALQRFSQRFESEPVTGTTRAVAGRASTSASWDNIVAITSDELAALHAQRAASGEIGLLPEAGDLKNNTLFLPWPEQSKAQGTKSVPPAQPGKLILTQRGRGKPWVTLQAVAAVPLAGPLNAGYKIARRVEAIAQHNPNLPDGHYSRGDILRVTLTIDASADMGWVAITDPIPAGATILGSGLGRDSQIATQGETDSTRGWLAWTERSFESWRSYWEYLPRGTSQVQYTVRLNQTGEFTLPPTRAEALYAPDMFGMTPNARVLVVEAAGAEK